MLSWLPLSGVLSGLTARLHSLWRGLRRRDELEAEMVEEFRHHLELRTEELIRRGFDPPEAARQARIEFGHIESHREQARASRGLRVFDRIAFSWLDVKLGVRMIRKYPGLSAVSFVGMSVAMAVGAGGFGFIHTLFDPKLPLPEGERVIMLQNADVSDGSLRDGQILQDFLAWSGDLGSVVELAAFTREHRSLDGAVGEPIPVARITASGFRVARVAPVLGRALVDSDERAEAPAVVVIAHEEWQNRFAGDSEIIGRIVRLDSLEHTVVGVMPAGFRFPLNDRYWVPLQLDARARVPGAGPHLVIFGRLADGMTRERAEAELSAIATWTAAESQRRESLRPLVIPYARAFIGIDSPATVRLLRSAQFGVGLLLLLVAVNVAVLVYARTAARTGEITVRSALGATRGRIISQLFAETLVLSVAAALLGLVITEFAFRWIMDSVRRGGGGGVQLPYWIELSLSPPVVAYVAGLALLAALIAGVLPAVKATGAAIQTGLQQLHSGGSQLRLGRTWTTMIVVQVAVAVAALPYTVAGAGPLIAHGMAEPDYATDEFLQASLSLAPDDAAGPVRIRAEHSVDVRFAASASALVRRLEAEPAVSAVTFSAHFPGNETIRMIEVEGLDTHRWVWVNRVDTDLFGSFGVSVLDGRGLVPADARASNAVVVDRAFAEHIVGDARVVGRRVRLLPADASADGDPGPWLEIVGIVPEFTVPPGFQPVAPKLYAPLALADAGGAVELAIRLKPDVAPADYAARLRELGSNDPAVRLTGLRAVSDEERERRRHLLSMAIAILAVIGSAVLLSAAGIHAMMAFSVTSRRREIGIRLALGATGRHVLTSVFRRSIFQLGAGVGIGLLLAEAVVRVGGGTFFGRESAFLLPLVAALMMGIGLLAALGPARRALAVDPVEALCDD